MIDGKTKLICLLGSPVGHSFSPKMHNNTLEKVNINARYLAFDVSKESLSSAINGLKAIDFIGSNVTIPHKTEVMKHLDHIDDRAKLIGAVNTVVNRDGNLYGYNTDIDGFIESFNLRDIKLQNKKVAVFGTGGSAKAVLVGLLYEKIDHIDVFSRELLKSKQLINDISYCSELLNPKTYSDLDETYPYDIIINTTPVGMHPNVDACVIDASNFGHKDTVFYDLVFNPLETRFLREARLSGRQTINGLDMLILQGLYSFKHWFPEADMSDITRDSVLECLGK